eukprot:m.91195 g.91195  ORF g.91195 m.91195 type:complete len:558 (-) comp18207_c0_seq2:51-1724(-)
MNVVKAVRDYISKMVSNPGMKVLLLDQDTTSIVSMVYAQSEVLQKEVYLIERIDNRGRETMHHLKAVCFVRPVPESIEALIAELRQPKYGQYDIYFSNVVRSSLLERLAEADEHEVVREVQEFFADYLAFQQHLFTFNLTGVLGDVPSVWSRPIQERTKQGLMSVLLALKKRPAIRFQRTSEICETMARELSDVMRTEAALFDFRQPQDVPPLMLILDRRDDPVTPLLNQWTYQAMVHELLGIHNNRVDLSKVPNISKELKEIVLNAEQDDFYRNNMYLNFGEIGQSIRTLVDEFQKKTKSHENIESIADMKNFVENYPQFRAMSGTVSKHVSVVGELSRLVDAHNLLDVSEAEQELACQANHSEVVQKMRQLLADQKVRDIDRLRLVMLYALRYERQDSTIDEFIETLNRSGVDGIRIIPMLRKYAGAGTQYRSSDLFGTKGAAGFLKRMAGGLKGVENIYTQHVPLLQTTLEQLAKGKLKDTAFPFVDSGFADKPQDVLVFICGGVTYEESKAVAQFNDANPSMRVTLGGTAIHNFKSFCKEISTSLKKEDKRAA